MNRWKLTMLATIIAVFVIGATPGGGGSLYSQDDKQDKQEEKKPPANLDVRNIDATALYLSKATVRLQELNAEGHRTGNFVKYNELKQKVADTLEEWKDCKVRWIVQVDNVGGPNGINEPKNKTKIKLIENYEFKNKAQIQIMIANGFTGRGFELIDCDEKWAKTLKRGDFIIMDAEIKQVFVIEGTVPRMSFLVGGYSKYTPSAPSKKK